MNEFHEDMIAHDKMVREQSKKEAEAKDTGVQYQIWEDILFKFSTEIMSRKERHIIEDLIKKYQIQKK